MSSRHPDICLWTHYTVVPACLSQDRSPSSSLRQLLCLLHVCARAHQKKPPTLKNQWLNYLPKEGAMHHSAAVVSRIIWHLFLRHFEVSFAIELWARYSTQLNNELLSTLEVAIWWPASLAQWGEQAAALDNRLHHLDYTWVHLQLMKGRGMFSESCVEVLVQIRSQFRMHQKLKNNVISKYLKWDIVLISSTE